MKRLLRSFSVLAAVVAVFALNITVMADPVKMSDGGLFDAEYYAENNPDVVEAYGNDANALYQHYKSFGKAEGRLPYAPQANEKKNESRPSGIPLTAVKMSDGGWFDSNYYAKANPDVVKALGSDANDLYNHYKKFGKKEGRLPYGQLVTSNSTAANTKKTNTSNASSEFKSAYNEVMNEYNKAYNDTLREYNSAVNFVASKLPSSVASEYKKAYNEAMNEYSSIYNQTMNEYQSMVNDIMSSFGF